MCPVYWEKRRPSRGNAARHFFRCAAILDFSNKIFFSFCCRFQKACIKYGVADVDLFQTTDLWDKKNVALVTTTIFAVGRAVSCATQPHVASRLEGMCIRVTRVLVRRSKQARGFVYVEGDASLDDVSGDQFKKSSNQNICTPS